MRHAMETDNRLGVCFGSGEQVIAQMTDTGLFRLCGVACPMNDRPTRRVIGCGRPVRDWCFIAPPLRIGLPTPPSLTSGSYHNYNLLLFIYFLIFDCKIHNTILRLLKNTCLSITTTCLPIFTSCLPIINA